MICFFAQIAQLASDRGGREMLVDLGETFFFQLSVDFAGIHTLSGPCQFKGSFKNVGVAHGWHVPHVQISSMLSVKKSANRSAGWRGTLDCLQVGGARPAKAVCCGKV